MSGESIRVMHPLFQAGEGGSTPTSPLHARDLHFCACDTRLAVALTRRWHSRLPNTQSGPWIHSFCAEKDGIVYAVALWNNPSARTLPQDWLELRRMACAPDAPKNTASRFLAWMARELLGKAPRLISYQDASVHSGTIYKAAGWTAAFTSAPRIRDRSKNRKGTTRAYRSNVNGIAPDGAAKVRWEKAPQQNTNPPKIGNSVPPQVVESLVRAKNGVDAGAGLRRIRVRESLHDDHLSTAVLPPT